MRRKPDCGFDLYFVKHVLEFLILIYVLCKSGVNLNSYGLLCPIVMCLYVLVWINGPYAAIFPRMWT